MLADLRQALRTLTRTPTLTLVTTITLALGLGSATVVLTLAHAILLSPLPYPDPDRLVEIWPRVSLPKEELVFLRDNTRSYQGLAAYWPWSAVSLTGDGEPESLQAAQVTTDFFTVLGVEPARGRAFSGDDSPSPPREVVLSDALWHRRFAADPAIVGRTLTLGGESFRVAGVMPESFRFPHGGVEVWLPIPLDPADAVDYSANYLSTVARLAPGVTRAAAQQELEAAVVGMRRELGRPDGYGAAAAVTGLDDATVRSVRPLLTALAAAVAFVLLIVAANLAHLLTLRGLDRAREIATRAALGAGRLRLMRLLLVESLLQVLLGGGAGLLAAAWGLELVLASLPEGTPRLHEAGLGAPFLAIAATATAAIWLLVGVVPALRTSRPASNAALAAAGERLAGERGGLRRSGLLVAAEVALALVLATGAGLAVNSFWRLTAVDPGFRPERVVSLFPMPPATAYSGWEQELAFYARVEERLAAVPGVESVGGVHMVPVAHQGFNGGLEIEGSAPEPGAALPRVNWRVVTPGYFGTLGIPVLAGRRLDAGDRQGSPEVALVNRSLAERFWPGEQAVGKRFKIDLEQTGWITVAGVVGDIHQNGLERPPLPEVYRPAAQNRRPVGLNFLVRSAGEPNALMPALRQAVWSVHPDAPVRSMRTLSGILERSTAEPRLLMRLLGFFAGLALLLGALGIYGVLAHEVHGRTREIGVRMALGARRPDVVRLVLRRALLLVAVGGALGLAALPALSGLLGSLLFEVTPGDPATVAAVLLVLVATAALAAWAPARRAVRLDPIEALRNE